MSRAQDSPEHLMTHTVEHVLRISFLWGGGGEGEGGISLLLIERFHYRASAFRVLE